jgi:hypothetical protein
MRQHGLFVAVGSWRSGILAALGTVLPALCGCGGEVYEERLGNTQILFAHESLLRENLQGEWTDAENGIGLRVPLKFQMLPPPARPEPATKPAGEEGENAPEEEAEVIDDRQPKYLNVELPGLRGAFQANVKVIADNNVEGEGDAWIYVMSNQDLADKTDEAKEFSQNLVKTLSQALEKAIDDKDWRDEYYPRQRGPNAPPTVSSGFGKPMRYATLTITSDADIGGFPRRFITNVHQAGEVQVIVLFVLPENVDGSEKFTERIPLCLETLTVASDRLVHKAPGGGGAAPPKESF